MNRIRSNIAVLIAAGAVLAGCGNHEEVAERYRLEKLLWKAQLREREINIAFLQASQRGLILATDAFTRVLAYDPLAQPHSARWDPAVVSDIERIQIVSRIALANLYFLGERYYDAGQYYNRSLRWPGLGFTNQLDIRLNLARTMYLAGETDSLQNQCELLFRQINDSELFWQGGVHLKDIFLQVPVFLVRFHVERGDEKRARDLGEVASAFYQRIASTWPDSSVADEARLVHVELLLLLEDWNRAIKEIDRLTGKEVGKRDPQGLLLLKAEVLAYGLDNYGGGEAIFRDIAQRYPGTPASYMARYNLAVLGLKRGERTGPERILKQLEEEASGNPDIAARAMLTLALQLEQTSRWDEALPLIRRILRLYPHSEAAIEAPLIVTAHYVAGNNEELAVRSLERATEFYLSLISKESNYAGNRLVLEDVLVRSYLLMGRAADAAILLEEKSVDWDEASKAAALLKAAEIYVAVMDDREGAVRTLKKCIELFPETRYAKLARMRLDKLEEG